MTTRAFIRGLWGEFQGSRYDRYYKIQKDLQRTFSLKEDFDYICYTMGSDNHSFLLDNGIKSNLIDPNAFKNHKYQWRHKLDIYHAAMQDFDEIVYLDWDCNLVKPIPDNFWGKLYNKKPIQGCLYCWRTFHSCNWREGKKDKWRIINNGFLYFREKQLTIDLIKAYDELPNSHIFKQNDETVTSYLIDKMEGGWKGDQYWLENYEPDCCYYSNGILRKHKKEEDIIFRHYKTTLKDGIYEISD